MRLAVIADTHGNILALDAVLADIQRAAPDLTVDLGDCVSGPLWPRETCERLMQLNMPTVAGNHERQVACEPRAGMGPSDAFSYDRLGRDHLAWLAARPKTVTPLDGVLACHGTPTDDNTFLLDRELATGGFDLAAQSVIEARLGDVRPALVLCAHSHHPRIVRLVSRAGTLIVNPGAVGLPQTGSPHARYAILTRHGDEWQVDLKAVTYDWDAAAKQAAANQRVDWANDLATGRNTVTAPPKPLARA